MWRAKASGGICGAPATHVLLTGSSQGAWDSCEAHVEPFVKQIRGPVRVLTISEWKAERW
jgi:hypothetical protein